MNRLAEKWIKLFESPLKVGQDINNKYTTCQVLGKGSYGFTYLVKDETNNIKVLKQLRKYKSLDQSGRDSFKREAIILSTLNHPGFPTFYEEFDENKKQFIVMEYMKGKTYEELIFHDKMKFNEKEAMNELFLVLGLVKQIHKIGCVHRDLRIPNLLKDGENNYIIDFGLARFISDRFNQDEQSGQQERTLFREIAYKSDFYALGHFLLFLLYSSYEPTSKKNQSWEEELKVSTRIKTILRRMLQLDEPYDDVEMIMKDVQDFIKEENNVFF